jgi:hypothetical protein
MAKKDVFYTEAAKLGLSPRETEILADIRRRKAREQRRLEAYWASPQGQKQKRIDAWKARMAEHIECYLRENDYYWIEDELERHRRELWDYVYELLREGAKIANAAVTAGRATPDENLWAIVKRESRA